MYNVNHDKSYLNLYARIRDVDFTDVVIGKICVQGAIGEEQQITALLEDLESTFKMYQYKKENGIKYGAEDLFYWGDRERYFDVTVQSDIKERHELVASEVLELINVKYANTNFYVRVQYHNMINWQKLDEFMKQDFNMDNLPINVIGAFYGAIQYGNGKCSKESANKIYDLSSRFISQYVGKKVLVNGEIKGTVKKLADCYGLFKPRATRTYYPLDLGIVRSIQVL